MTTKLVMVTPDDTLSHAANRCVSISFITFP
jgi:hypothetical protein